MEMKKIYEEDTEKINEEEGNHTQARSQTSTHAPAHRTQRTTAMNLALKHPITLKQHQSPS